MTIGYVRLAKRDAATAELRQPVVVDPGCFLAPVLWADPTVRSAAVGLVQA